MTPMDLHPEDLIEREMCGDLSPVERARLETHAQQCAACKLERLARADFRRDAEGPEAEVDVQRLLAAVSGPLAMREASRVASRPRMRHVRFLLVAAAVISVTGLAAAARWSGTRMLVVASVPAPPPVMAVAPVAGAPRHHVARAAEAAAASTSEQAALDPLATAPVATPPVAAVAPVVPVGVVEIPRATPRSAALAPVARVAVEPASSPVPAAPAVAALPVEAGPDAPTIFRRANAAREMGDHARAGELYRRLLDDFATSPEARASLPMFGRMLLDDGNASGALGRFDDALRVGTGALREDVMLGRALALQHLGRPDDEARAWSALLDAYPSSVHAERARRRLLELGRR
ncbi:MAG: tetratricopeptide repeat protein [Polyangiaceae bacterium]